MTVSNFCLLPLRLPEYWSQRSLERPAKLSSTTVRGLWTRLLLPLAAESAVTEKSKDMGLGLREDEKGCGKASVQCWLLL